MSDVAVVLMAYGSPERLADVPAYYADIRGGRPIRPELLDDLVERYRRLDIESGSPLNAVTEETRAALEAGPQTFCHLDFYPENLFGDGEEAILVDWAYCGLGALGEDPGNFVPDALLDGFVPAEQADELERAVWEGYRAGLAEAGWTGDEGAVRLAFCATPWLKYRWVPAALTSWPLDDAKKEQWRRTLPLIDRLGEEARELASRA